MGHVVLLPVVEKVCIYISRVPVECYITLCTLESLIDTSEFIVKPI